MSSKAGFFSANKAVFVSAFKYSVPVLLGYTAIGIAFGLLVIGTGYPWYLALAMSLWMYAGAGQFIALGLFAAGTSLWEACFVQLIVNARHTAYGLSMLKRFSSLGPFKPYMVFSLTDETFALLSSFTGRPATDNTQPGNTGPAGAEEQKLFMFFVAFLDQCYWVTGSVIGAVAGTLIPVDTNGIGFALTALFVVLMIEQIKIVKRPGVFLVSCIAALLGVFMLPGRIALLAALIAALVLSPFFTGKQHE